jgi:hypothetical protein
MPCRPAELALGLGQDTALGQIHAPPPPGSPPLRLCWAGSTSCRDLHLLDHAGSTPCPSTHTPQALLGPSSTWDNQIRALPGAQPLGPCWIHTTRTPPPPPPLKPPTPRHCWAPAPHGMTGAMPGRDPCSSGLGTRLAWDNRIPQSTGILTPWAEPVRSSTGFTDKRTTSLLLRLPLEGCQRA